MRLVPLGDSALLAELGGQSDEKTATAVRRLAGGLQAAPVQGVEAIVPSFTTVAVHFNAEYVPGSGDAASMVASWIGRVWAKGGSGRAVASREVVLPVAYGGEDGPDLADVAKACGLSPGEVIRRHSRVTYQVRAVGFSPGFPYLAGLHSSLRVARRSSPRTQVPAGSVAIGAGQTGVYPSATPGGWNLIGRTARPLFDPLAMPPALVRPGDRVKFSAVTSEVLSNQTARNRSRVTPSSQAVEPVFTVLRPGLMTTVQDLGRIGFEDVGVSPGGAVDARALRVANLLVGNRGTEAGLECTLRGPRLAVRKDCWVAITGAPVVGLPWARPFRVAAGSELSLEALERGCRCYLAVAGGVDVPEVLGSRSTYLAAGWGGFEGRALRPGDRLGTLGKDSTVWPTGGWFAAPELAPWPEEEEVTVRVVRGPQADWFPARAWQEFLGSSYRISPRSDRMGARLEGSALQMAQPKEMASEAVAVGSVQVPPDGQPIVLLAERQTIGGYPKIANVITVDFARLAQARPGMTLRFSETTLDDARRLLREAARDFMWLQLGLSQKANIHGAR